MEQVEVQGLRIAYVRAGTGPGPPVVLAQGFVGDAWSSWSQQIESLSDEYTVVAWDAPGAGQSSRPPEWFRLPDYADCLVGFLGALGFQQAHLVGLSVGGALVLEVFALHPTVVRSLTLVSGYAGWAGSLTMVEVDDRLRACLEASDLPPREFADVMMPSMFSASAPADVVAGFAESVMAFDRDGFRTMAISAAEADLRSVLPKVDVPTLLLYGDQDVRAPLRVGRELASSIPGSKLVVMPGLGHVSSVEGPETVSREIRDFLRDTESERTRP